MTTYPRERPAHMRPKPINHGTYGGVKTHRRRGEKPCEDCLEAEREYNRKDHEARRATTPTTRPVPPRRRPTSWYLDPYVDEVVVERRIAGDHTVALTYAEQDALIDRMERDGWSHSAIERRTGLNVSRVLRRRQKAAA